MAMFPGSDQYPLITPFQEIVGVGSLPAANADTGGEIFCVGMGRVTLLCQYAKTEFEQSFLGTGVTLKLFLSPYSSANDVPVGGAEWFPVTVLRTAWVAGCQTNSISTEVAEITYCGSALDDTVEAWTLDFSLPSHSQRIEVLVHELDESEGAGEGVFACYALLSGDPGGEFGWTMKSITGAEPVA